MTGHHRDSTHQSTATIGLLVIVSLAAILGVVALRRRVTEFDLDEPLVRSRRGRAIQPTSTDSPPATVTGGRRLEVALEPLRGDVIVQRSLDIFPAGYLANISIIQGVALSVLVSQSVPLLIDDHATDLSRIATLTESLFVFVGIVIVSYEYLWFTTIMRWVPTFRDTLVPLLLGIGEIVPALLLDDRFLWWTVITVFIGLGGAAYLNTVSRLRLELFGGNEYIRRLVSGLLWRLVACCIAGMMVSIATTRTVMAWPENSDTLTILGASVLILSVAVGMVGLSERTLNAVYTYYGIRRRPVFPRWTHCGWHARDTKHSA